MYKKKQSSKYYSYEMLRRAFSLEEEEGVPTRLVNNDNLVIKKMRQKMDKQRNKYESLK